jgi:hypothetical protein
MVKKNERPVGVPAARGHGVTSAENARNAAPQAPVPPSLRSLVNRRAAHRLEQDHSALALRRRLWALGFILFSTNDLYILPSQEQAESADRLNLDPASDSLAF